MFDSYKGITPVIAIVLLLLVTVGAVGVVYTQFQDLVGEGPDTEFLEDVEVEIHSVERAEYEELGTDNVELDTMEIRMENLDDEDFVLDESLRMEYSIPGESRIEPFLGDGDEVEEDEVFQEYDTFDFSEGENDEEDQCLVDVSEDEDGNDVFFNPQETVQCDTGVQFPDADSEITIHLVEEGSGEEATSYTCDPTQQDSLTC